MLENVVDYDSDNEGQDNNRSDFDFLNPDLLDVLKIAPCLEKKIIKCVQS